MNKNDLKAMVVFAIFALACVAGLVIYFSL
jgi:hypothetical protein